jgi:hypothetical protein
MRDPRVLRIVGSLVAALAALAVSVPAAAQGTGAQPPELLMSVGIGPDNTLDSLRAFANAMQPGVGSMMSGSLLRMQLAKMTTAASLDGLDDKGTLYVLAVDGGPALKGVAVAGKIADEKRLTQGVGPAHLVKKNGWAVIGPKLVAEKVAPFAVGSLAGQAISGPPVATIYTANLLTRYKTEIADARQKMTAGFASGGGQMAALGQLYADGLFSMLADSERVVVTFDVTKDVAALDLGLVPKAGSRLAKFVGLQRPSDYGLAGKLPAMQAPILAVGRFDSGPYRTGLLELTAQMYGASSSFIAATEALFKAATGDFAMTMVMGGQKGMEFSMLLGVTDDKAGEKAVGRMLDAVKKPVSTTMMGMTTTQVLSPNTTTHDGVTIRAIETTYDLSKATPETRAAVEKMIAKGGTTTTRLAVLDQLVAFAASPDGSAATATIDAVRGKGKRYTPAAVAADFLAGSRARKESLAAVMDIGLVTGTGPGRMVMLAMGFADKRAHLRFALPAATMRAFAGGAP